MADWKDAERRKEQRRASRGWEGGRRSTDLIAIYDDVLEQLNPVHRLAVLEEAEKRILALPVDEMFEVDLVRVTNLRLRTQDEVAAFLAYMAPIRRAAWGKGQG